MAQSSVKLKDFGAAVSKPGKGEDQKLFHGFGLGSGSSFASPEPGPLARTSLGHGWATSFARSLLQTEDSALPGQRAATAQGIPEPMTAGGGVA